MLVIYSPSDGKILNILWDKDNLAASGSYIEIDEIEANKSLLLDLLRSMANDVMQYTVTNNKLYNNLIEVPIAIDLEKSQLKVEYQNMITRLETIQAASNPTNVQVVQAIKDEALYIERIMKVLKKLVV